MAVLMDEKPAMQNIFATPAKSRLLRTLVRHASAPASPRLTPDAFIPSEGGLNITQLRLLPSPRSSTAPSRSRQNLLSEISLAQSFASRLHRDRDNWRSLAQRQTSDVTAAENVIKEQACTIAELQEEKASLDRRLEDDHSKGKQLHSRFQDLITKHDKLVDQLNDALRTINRLKKSDRAKGKVQQRNLRLKAVLQRYTSRGGSSTSLSDAGIEATLIEALALASEHIEDLESKGEALLDALEERNAGSGSDGESEMKERDAAAELLEAEDAFRGVIEDEAFKEQKAGWGDLLNE